MNTSKAFHTCCISPIILCHYYHDFLLQRKWCGVNKHNAFDTCLWPRCFCSSALEWIKLWQMLLIPCFIVASPKLGCTHWESLSLLHVFLKCSLVLRKPNIDRVINHSPHTRCWEKYPREFQGLCGPAAGFCYWGEVWMGFTHQTVKEECSHPCGQQKEELDLTGNLVSSSLHLIPPPPHFSPRSPRLCLCFKWQDTNQKWERERARLSLQGCAGSSGLWFQHMHLAFCNIPPLHPMLCVDSKGMIHPD